MKPLKLTPAAGGWLHADWGDGKAWLRLGKDKQGRLARLTELHLFDPSPERLRRVPLKRIHSAVTMRGAGAVQLALALRLNEQPPPDMFDSAPPAGMKLERRFRLKWKPRRRLDDDFLREVAHAYQSAVAHGLNPRKAIIEDTGAADATVAGWIMEARKRGYLPPARPGKVTA